MKSVPYVPQISEGTSTVEDQPLSVQPAASDSPTPESDSSVERTQCYPQRVRKHMIHIQGSNTSTFRKEEL